jgi:hypothetical protein
VRALARVAVSDHESDVRRTALACLVPLGVVLAHRDADCIDALLAALAIASHAAAGNGGATRAPSGAADALEALHRLIRCVWCARCLLSHDRFDSNALYYGAGPVVDVGDLATLLGVSESDTCVRRMSCACNYRRCALR